MARVAVLVASASQRIGGGGKAGGGACEGSNMFNNQECKNEVSWGMYKGGQHYLEWQASRTGAYIPLFCHSRRAVNVRSARRLAVLAHH